MKNRSCKFAFIPLVFAAGLVSVSAESQTFNPDNGHYYQYISSPGISWTQANTQASSLSFNGLQGYLATVTSAQETTFFANNLTDAINNNTWLGGYQDRNAPDYSEPSGGYRWVTGEAWEYNNWAGGEPNNNGGFEDYVHIYGTIYGNKWNDTINNPASQGVTINGFTVEYSVVPAPSALAAFVIGAVPGAMVLLRRRRKA